MAGPAAVAARRLAMALALLVLSGAAPATRTPAAPGVPPRARFVATATFDSLAIVGAGAWSPRGARLALVGPGHRLWVYDATAPQRPARMAWRSAAWIHSLSWSPDGAWLLVLAGEPHPRNLRTLLAVDLARGTADTLVPGADIGPAVWGPDGRLYLWAGRKRNTFDPPRGWTPAPGVALAPPPTLEVAGDLSLRLRPWAPGGGEEPALLGADFAAAAGATVRIADRLPDGSRSLVGVSRDTVARWLVVDREGRTLLDLRRAGLGFTPTSLSGDGRRIAGFAGRWRGEEGWSQTTLMLADAGGAWWARIEGVGSGIGPQFARAGDWLAFVEPVSGATRVGRVVVAPR